MLKRWVGDSAGRIFPPRIRETLSLRGFGLRKIPLLFLVSPSVIESSEQGCTVKIPLNRITRNHLGSMYFGVLAIGADCAAGSLAMNLIEASGKRISLVFKDFHADFLKRPEGDVYFHCREGREIQGLIDQVIETGERGNLPVHVVATVPSVSESEPVAKFTLTLSLKKA